MSIRFRFRKFKLDEGRMTKEVRAIVLESVLAGAAEAFRDTYHLIPVHTGESRGGLRGIPQRLTARRVAEAIGLFEMLMGSIQPVDEQRIRFGAKERGRDAIRKSPRSASSKMTDPRYAGNKLILTILNDADGFFYADKRAQKNTGPWKWAAEFSRKWKIRTKEHLALNAPRKIKSFLLRQREVVRYG